MLIGCCGVGGAGKTATAKALAAELGLPFIASSSRAVFERRGIVEADQAMMTGLEQWDLQQEIFRAREQLETTITRGVADRTLMDQFAYNLLRAGSAMDEATCNDLSLRVIHSLTRYTLVFRFPIVTFTTHDDGMRESAYGARISFDAILDRVIQNMETITGKRVPVVPLGPIDARVAWMQQEIKDVL